MGDCHLESNIKLRASHPDARKFLNTCSPPPQIVYFPNAVEIAQRSGQNCNLLCQNNCWDEFRGDVTTDISEICHGLSCYKYFGRCSR